MKTPLVKLLYLSHPQVKFCRWSRCALNPESLPPVFPAALFAPCPSWTPTNTTSHISRHQLIIYIYLDPLSNKEEKLCDSTGKEAGHGSDQLEVTHLTRVKIWLMLSWFQSCSHSSISFTVNCLCVFPEPLNSYLPFLRTRLLLTQLYYNTI